MNSIVQAFVGMEEVRSVSEGIRRHMEEQLVTGLSGSARHFYLAALRKQTGAPMMVVTHNLLQAQKVYEDLQVMLQGESVWLYPADDNVAAEWLLQDKGLEVQRIAILESILHQGDGVLVVPYSAWRRLLPPRNYWKQQRLHLLRGESHPLQEVVAQLVDLGYTRVSLVEEVGEFALRGGILDIYPPHLPHPVRMEWFDDELDSLRSFDPQTQRSISNLDEMVIMPASESVAPVHARRHAAEQLRKRLEEQMAKEKDPQRQKQWETQVGSELEKMREGLWLEGQRKYMSVLFPGYENILQYMPKNTVVVLDEPARIQEVASQLEKEEAEAVTHFLEEGRILPQLKLSFEYQELVQRVHGPILYLSSFARQLPGMRPQQVVHCLSRSMQQFHGQMHLLKTEMERWEKADYQVVFAAADAERCQRLQRVLRDYGMEADLISSDSDTLPQVPAIMVAQLQSGFEIPTLRLALITEREVFTKLQRKVSRAKPLSGAERIQSYQDLAPGDYVVHVNHGIGRYKGIKTLEVDGKHKDYLHIQYAGGDTLYVPVEQIELVQKYIGADDQEPKLYSLGGSEWSRVKKRVRSSVQDLAEELIKLYAKRVSSPGYAYGPDTPYQREFEALFPYEETPDQLRAVEEIKRDMERPYPMDRLLCGDVGYGKTEVAIRAVFKAVMEGKQVAVLVPTTILAQQHYETFRDRFSGYPVRIEVLSRFRTRKEISETLRGLKDGTVDVVIGTHRLLSKDVAFRDLGLLVVDEEQRFGVSHKEKLKQMKTNVDVLTLTATPIPRTLHMSMLGVRDLSVIETPPENRFPVQTYVVEYSPALVREAIEREISRGGQVFFLYNQVQGIYTMAEQLSALVPDARILVAHGQMPERELEKTILDFMDGEADVLVCTTIIESGIDFPNVNTLIVYQADHLGLSQLYQLRGRVGRSNRIAYAYFTYLPQKVLSEVAEKRLLAIREFTELGSGFKIALRDLSIRGAGNLLGPEQHGFIASVGFDLYNQMLREAIAKLKEEPDAPQERPLPQLEINVDAYLPDAYVPDSTQKIALYKRISALRTMEEIGELQDECLDRYGDFPAPVQRLLAVAQIRVLAGECGIRRIWEEKGDWNIQFEPDAPPLADVSRLVALASQYPKRVRLSSSGNEIEIRMNVVNMDPTDALDMLERFLRQLLQVPQEDSKAR